ncbi:MBL fold metallo-hydrolase [Thermodesulfobacteriota bacterium]
MTDHTRPETNPVKGSDYNLAVCVLASGSKGNAIFISNGDTAILLDAGLSGIEIERRLNFRGLCPENLDAIIVSHEHNDHVQGVGVLSRRFDLPVYMNAKTGQATLSMLGRIREQKFFECGSPFKVKTLRLHPFSVSHDAKDPAGFTINQNGTKIGIATDLGIATSMVKEHLKECNLMILEANHDPTMLVEGPYPWPLKQRIKSRTGHLSNTDSKNLLQEVKHNCLEHVILAHLSETNNTPQKALSEVSQAISGCNARLTVATQDVCGSIFQLI